MQRVEIGNIIMDEDNIPLVIPEIGINHEGNLETAKKMVDAAHRAGARLVKHQTHVCADEMCGAAKEILPGNSDVSIYEVMERCSLSEDEEEELKDYIESLGMLFLSTPFSRAAADRLEKFGVKAYKIGSGELNNYPLLEHVAEFGKPMILSTGMNDLKSIEKAVNIMERYGVPYALMHTTNLYPTKAKNIRLGAMLEMMKAFPGIQVGLSDHSLNNNACIAAMALGASLVERHFTDYKERSGPDIICSMDEQELKELLGAARGIHQMMGGHKSAIAEEQITINFAFASVVSLSAISKGEQFTRENLWVKRPGIGEIPAEQYKKVLGKVAACDIPADVLIEENMVKGYNA